MGPPTPGLTSENAKYLGWKFRMQAYAFEKNGSYLMTFWTSTTDGSSMVCHRYVLASTEETVDQCWVKPPKPE